MGEAVVVVRLLVMAKGRGPGERGGSQQCQADTADVHARPVAAAGAPDPLVQAARGLEPITPAGAHTQARCRTGRADAKGLPWCDV